jgi:acetolactate synthase-1/2/3 large subunit
MNGAESLVRTLLKGGVEVCFANPGTSEMHFVGALDRVEGMRCVLGLFEGVCSGAADGYYRMTDTPASTLLHLGPGLANAAANLHNAKKAGSGIVNIVGEHALYHIKYDTPLTATSKGIARPFSHWVKTSPTSKTVAGDGALAIQAARVAPGRIATLILPADTAWGEATASPTRRTRRRRPGPTRSRGGRGEGAQARQVRDAASWAGARCARAGLELAGKIAAKTDAASRAPAARRASSAARAGSRCCGSISSSRPRRSQLKGTEHMVLVGAKPPAAFFAYPGKPSVLTPEGCETTTLCPVEAIPSPPRSAGRPSWAR